MAENRAPGQRAGATTTTRSRRAAGAASRRTPEPAADGRKPERGLLDALEWRLVGPFRGGRVVAVAGHPTRQQEFYFGSTGGGVWKTTDGGVFWQNVSDGYFKRASVGAIAVAESDPNTIYAGMGEPTIRGNVSHGDGVYKSTDGGKTWRQAGLAETRHIAKIRVHPQNPDLVYVAALGHAHGPNEERGLFRSKDGGQTWEAILQRGEDAGAIDLSMDPNNPRILYCAFWEARRGPHYLNSGGPGSGLFKSTDGGDTWQPLLGDGLWLRDGGKGGSPVPITRQSSPIALGKIGVAVSPPRPDRVWAIVEAEDGAVFRSDDGGETWQRLCEDRNLRQRAWYYHHIYADPQDPETVWVLNVEAWKSTDGGKTFFTVPIPHGDNHDLWLDPRNTDRLICGNDGGATVSFNGGETWSNIYNQPTAEFYHVTTDNQVPYRIYGAQQDNTTITVPSRSAIMGITRSEEFEVGGGESGYIAVDPRDPNIIYAGSYQGLLTRYDHQTGQHRNVMVWPEMSAGWGAKALKYRFQWTYPILISPHDPGTLYVTSNHVHRSRDEGTTWEVISPDLTRNDPSKGEPSGGPITKDNTGAEYYCTIFAFAESPVQPGLFWAGSDDGLVHLSRDGGRSWQNVTPKDLPEWALISIVEPSPHDPAAAYLAATRYKLDDFQPYLYQTNDYGQTWTRITNGIPADDFTRVIREDPKRRGLLYAGTETGVYVSCDDGAHWQRVQGNLPVVPIHDLAVKDDDLVLATHGRSFWVLDDITPIRQLADLLSTQHSAPSTPHLFQPRPTIRFLTNRGFGHPPGPGKNYQMTGATIVPYRQRERETGEMEQIHLDSGKNPPDGVVVTYSLAQEPAGEVRLTFLDADGNEIKSFTSKRPEGDEGPTTNGQGVAGEQAAPAAAEPDALAGEGVEGIGETPKAPEAAEGKEPRVPAKAGLNRFVWNMRYPDPKKLAGDESLRMAATIVGPLAPPGAYQVRLTVDGQSYTAPFEIRPDPRRQVPPEEFAAQFALLREVGDKVSQTHETINQIRTIRSQAEEWERRAERDARYREVGRAAKALKEKLTAVEEELIQTKAKSRQDTLNFPIKLNAKLAALLNVIGSADGRPTASARELFGELSAKIDEQRQRLQAIVDADVAAVNQLVQEASLPAIQVPSADGSAG